MKRCVTRRAQAASGDGQALHEHRGEVVDLVDLLGAQRSRSAQRARKTSGIQQGNAAGGGPGARELSAAEARHTADVVGRQGLVVEGLANDGNLSLHAGDHRVAASSRYV